MAIRSATYLQGNKYLLWDDIKKYFKHGERKVLVDCFFGSGTVSLNARNENLYEHIIGNDSAEWQINLHKAMQDPEFIITTHMINDLYPETVEGFLAMKAEYNKDISRMDYLYNLMCRSNTNMTRFSGQGVKRKYNMSYGKRAVFNLDRTMRNKVLLEDVELHNQDFKVFLNGLTNNLESKSYLPEDATVYLDCPYFNSTATYNEGGGWTVEDDELLRDRAVSLHEEGYHVVSSNAFHNRGMTNQGLIDWTELHKDKFTVHYMNRDYSNCSSFKSEHPTVEVLIVSK